MIKINTIDIKTLLEKLNDYPINIIDIRENYQYLIDRIPTSKNIDRNLLKEFPEKYLNKNETYYIYCQSGITSNNLVNYLNSKGYNTVNINGGYNNYLLRK